MDGLPIYNNPEVAKISTTTKIDNDNKQVPNQHVINGPDISSYLSRSWTFRTLQAGQC